MKATQRKEYSFSKGVKIEDLKIGDVFTRDGERYFVSKLNLSKRIEEYLYVYLTLTDVNGNIEVEVTEPNEEWFFWNYDYVTERKLHS